MIAMITIDASSAAWLSAKVKIIIQNRSSNGIETNERCNEMLQCFLFFFFFDSDREIYKKKIQEK